MSRCERIDERTLVSLIAASSLGSALNGHALERLADTSVSRRVQEGEILFRRDTPARRFFMVVDGVFKLYRISVEGEEKVIGWAGVGDSFAEGVTFMEAPRYPMYAQAVEDSVVSGLSCDVWREALVASPETCLMVMRHLTGRITGLVDEIESLSLFDGRVRVIRFLLGLMSEIEPREGVITVTLPIRKNMISAHLSIRPETLSRILAGLIQEGLVLRTADPRKLEIPRPDVLQQAFDRSIGAGSP